MGDNGGLPASPCMDVSEPVPPAMAMSEPAGQMLYVVSDPAYDG